MPSWALVMVASALLALAGCASHAAAPVPPTRSRPASRPPQPGNTTQPSFRQAKRVLRDIYDGHRVTFYCGCRYDDHQKVDHASCGYVPRRDTGRAHRVEWEHVVPAAWFGRSFRAWTEGHPRCVDGAGKPYRGRQCARKVAARFRLMEADLYNLVPAIGEVNALRADYPMALIAGERREFGACDVEIANARLEPRPQIRGDVARVMLYMQAAYPDHRIVVERDRGLLEQWAAQDPVDGWECERARRIQQVQGNVNWVVAQACRAAGH